MPFNWFRRRPTEGQSDPKPPTPASPATPRDQWTIAGTYFDTAGWRLTESSATSMSWVGDHGGDLTLTRDVSPTPQPQPLDLDAARREHRARAAHVRGGIISVEPVAMPNGLVALEVITKHPFGAGFGFDGDLVVDEAGHRYSAHLTGNETLTGVRESIVNGLMMQLGEIDLVAVMAQPADPKTGGRRIPGLTHDPYDSAYDEGAIYSVSDDPRIDPLLPTHPLATIRATLHRLRSTWELPARIAPDEAERSPPPVSSGPKIILSDHVVRAL